MLIDDELDATISVSREILTSVTRPGLPSPCTFHGGWALGCPIRRLSRVIPRLPDSLHCKQLCSTLPRNWQNLPAALLPPSFRLVDKHSVRFVRDPLLGDCRPRAFDSTLWKPPYGAVFPTLPLAGLRQPVRQLLLNRQTPLVHAKAYATPVNNAAQNVSSRTCVTVQFRDCSAEKNTCVVAPAMSTTVCDWARASSGYEPAFCCRRFEQASFSPIRHGLPQPGPATVPVGCPCGPMARRGWPWPTLPAHFA